MRSPTLIFPTQDHFESAAEIDPEWAAQIAEQLMDEEFRTDRLRQIFVLDSLLDGLAKP